ncbi:MAG: hypothetical protein ACO3N4_01425 [Ilumatobacteraceae bacterium]
MPIESLTVPIVLAVGAVSTAGGFAWWLSSQLKAVSSKIDDLRLHIVSSYVTHAAHDRLSEKVDTLNDRVVRLEATHDLRSRPE